MPEKEKRKKDVVQRYDVRADNRYMSFLAGLRDIVTQAMVLEDVSVTALARKASLHPNTVKRFLGLQGETIAPQLPTVYRILKGVDRMLSVETPSEKPRKRRARRT